MSALPLESRSWPRGRWLMIIGIVLAVQLGLILWLANHGPAPTPSAARIVPPRVLVPADTEADSPGSSDPIFFVRANARGFSGPAWMNNAPMHYEQPVWSDPTPPSNNSPAHDFGASLNQFLQTNLTTTIELAPQPKPVIPPGVADDIAENAQSTFTISGTLTKRTLLASPKLQSWPATETTEVLADSVVQTGVDADGNVFSAILTTPCGSKEADARALALARAARFKPLTETNDNRAAKQTWGQMTFHWRTVPLSSTNRLTARP